MTEYLCPGCFFLGKKNIITLSFSKFICSFCREELKSSQDSKRILFFKTFSIHNKNGYHCEDCKRFIPHPINDSSEVICPYYDCAFGGQIDALRKMHHPNINSKAIKPFIDILEIKPIINESNNVKLLNEIIDTYSNNVHYSSSNFTIKLKYLAYQSFKNLLSIKPIEMSSYLIDSSRTGGFQHKAFQEYIRLLELSLPFNINKHNKLHKIDSLLNNNLNIFDGISEFDAKVDSKLEIKNNTKEFYIGGRKAFYTKPYYIGKLLGIMDKSSKEILINNVSEYSFSKIKMKDIEPNTEVVVTHLRIPPHYEMGGMTYINRARKSIVERYNLLSKGINV